MQRNKGINFTLRHPGVGNLFKTDSPVSRSYDEVTSSSFFPLQIPSLRLWLKSEAGVTLTGSTVGIWEDQSGWEHHATQTTGSFQPHFSASDPNTNNYPSLVFHTASLIIPNHLDLELARNSGGTIYIIAWRDYRSGGEPTMSKWDEQTPGPAPRRSYLLRDQGVGNCRYFHRSGSGDMEEVANVNNQVNNVANNELVLYRYSVDNQTGDKSSITIQVYWDLNFKEQVGNSGKDLISSSSTDISIGSTLNSNDVPTSFGHFNLAEILMFNENLDTFNYAENMLAYLRNKYNILPSLGE